ncbi:hypothetical protein [Williamsia soli]|uniref:hypothetical protein n=1 Tax=Williamsia soli TaxID=364929 RepID=UPI001A9D7C98|nr:hypothetical protein [Williamsia soli]
MSDHDAARGPVAAVIAALAALLVILLAGCGGATGPDQPSPGPSAGHDHDHELPGAPDAPDPATAGPDVVAAQALSMMFTWQPVTDPSSGAALRRAAPWLGGDLAAAASSTQTATPERPDSRWASWRRSGDVVTATADVDAGHIPDTPTTAVRLVTVRQQTLHSGGDTTPLTPMRIEATLSHTDTGWRLTVFTVTAG